MLSLRIDVYNSIPFQKNEDWDAEERVSLKDDWSKSSTKNVLVDDHGSYHPILHE